MYILQVHHSVVLLVFSITFALSCTMFELIIFEIIGFLDPGYVSCRVMVHCMPGVITMYHFNCGAKLSGPHSASNTIFPLDLPVVVSMSFPCTV